MRYAILLQRENDGKYSASVPAIPGLVKKGETRKQTIKAIQEAIVSSLETTEWIYLDIPQQTIKTDESNPWLEMAGIFADDPSLVAMLEEIYAEREVQ